MIVVPTVDKNKFTKKIESNIRQINALLGIGNDSPFYAGAKIASRLLRHDENL